MNASVATPIVQLEYPSQMGPRCGPPIVPKLTTEGMRAMREAYWNGEPWGENGGRIVVLIEDPFTVEGVK